MPHFEKMLYDNALLILACCAAGQGTKNENLKRLLLSAARETGDYVLRELRSPEGNFAGKSIPNLIQSDLYDRSFAPVLPKVLAYRQNRTQLHTDHRILTAWNGLMIAAMCVLYRTTQEEAYLCAAKQADAFLKRALREGGVLYASFAGSRWGSRGFLDDYAALALAQLALYGATLEEGYIQETETLCQTVLQNFSDPENGGYFLTAADAERLLLRSKELYDGAMPSGNSLMAWNLVRLHSITQKDEWRLAAERQLSFLSSAASAYPVGYAMTLLAKLSYDNPTTLSAVSPRDSELQALPFVLPPHAAMRTLRQPTEEHPLQNGKTSWYLCSNHRCMPPVNRLEDLRHICEAKPSI